MSVRSMWPDTSSDRWFLGSLLVLGHEETYCVKEHSYSKYSKDDIIKMFEFLVDIIVVVFARKFFQHSVGISMGTNCAPLPAEIFPYSYEMELIQSLL